MGKHHFTISDKKCIKVIKEKRIHINCLSSWTNWDRKLVNAICIFQGTELTSFKWLSLKEEQGRKTGNHIAGVDNSQATDSL